ncbi:MAG: HlyD family efflux transporter periplasmic adaptor subunit [Phyllobacteriaceae bacterium]|nr:HlyD family efflux transporter periplasmic adaptor subunit [Phyllobacteriaceae bacterium]
MPLRPKSVAGFSLAAIAIAAGLWWAFRERPTGVDLATIATGPMTVAIEEDGIARVREVYRISAPVTGRLDRSILSVGDKVEAGKTIIARLNPVDPPFLDERSRAEVRAGVDAAAAAVGLAKAELSRAEAALAQAVADLERAERLARSGVVSESQLEKARADVRYNEAGVASANAQVALRESELSSMKAKLIEPGDDAGGPDGAACCVSVAAPLDGVVLEIHAKSEQVIAAGSPIADVGDPADLEIAVDLLSQDAVKLAPGAAVIIAGYGGEAIAGTLRRISPSAATKISALGIEEQRVLAIVDLAEPAARLGHNFRVRASIEEWRSDKAVIAPVSALFRLGAKWAAFRLTGDRAERVMVEIGRLNGREAQILSGLSVGDRVVVHPSDAIVDGALVAPRAD